MLQGHACKWQSVTGQGMPIRIVRRVFGKGGRYMATKTLVFSFDGTGNEPGDAAAFTEDESISNVLKLHVLMGGGLQTDKSATATPNGGRQETRYYNGIGTRTGGYPAPLLGRLITTMRRHVNMAFAPTFGDARRILKEAEGDFEAADYQPGDNLVVFGFSRGAALARKFVSRILAAHGDGEVAFLGVFDTVAAMNGVHRKGETISSDVVFENGTLNDRVKRAVHIVALDEDRVPFTPTLINRDPANPDRILEVWFPGVHSDVGGGYWYDGLSDLALQFMIEQCHQALQDDLSIAPGDGASVRRLLAQQGSQLADLTADDVAIHPLINGVMHLHSGLAAKAVDQEPRAVYVSDNDRPSRDPDAVPLVHWSVKERFDTVTGYRPAALRGLRYRLLLEDGRRSSEVMEGIAGLREYPLRF